MHPDEGIRDEATRCEQEIQKFQSELGLNRALYDVFASMNTEGFDTATKRLVKHTVRDFRRAGVDKDEQTQTRIKAINEELTKLGQTFTKNITEDVRWVEADPKDLEGMPADWLKAHEPKGSGKVKGQY